MSVLSGLRGQRIGHHASIPHNATPGHTTTVNSTKSVTTTVFNHGRANDELRIAESRGLTKGRRERPSWWRRPLNENVQEGQDQRDPVNEDDTGFSCASGERVLSALSTDICKR